jgi:hypothetical protein
LAQATQAHACASLQNAQSQRLDSAKGHGVWDGDFERRFEGDSLQRPKFWDFGDEKCIADQKTNLMSR